MTEVDFEADSNAGNEGNRENLKDHGVNISKAIYATAVTEEGDSNIENGEKIIYEAAFQYSDVLSIADIVVKDKGKWNVYEVKSSTEFKDKYINDLRFQTNAFKLIGVDLKSINLIHVNNQYVFDEKKGYEYEKLFVNENKTDEVMDGLADQGVSQQMLDNALVKIRSSLYDDLGNFFGLGRADLLCSFALFDDNPARINEIENEFKEITPEDINAAIAEYLRNTNRTILTLKPLGALN